MFQLERNSHFLVSVLFRWRASREILSGRLDMEDIIKGINERAGYPALYEKAR